MFGASRSVAGSHLINLRRQRSPCKGTHSLVVAPPANHSKPQTVSATREAPTIREASYVREASSVWQYVIPNFAKFEFWKRNGQEGSNSRKNVRNSEQYIIIIKLSMVSWIHRKYF